MGAVGSADINRLAEALRQTAQESEVTTQQVLIEAANFLLTEMEVRVPVDSGALRQSLGVRVMGGGKIHVGPNTPYAGYVEFGTQPHQIKPKRADGVLRFKVNGQWVYAKVVNHPGTRAQPYVRPAFDAWVDSLGPMVVEANVKTFTDAYRAS